MTIDDDLSFRVKSKGWQLGAETGERSLSTGPSNASGRVQVTIPNGYLMGSSANFDADEGWLDIKPAEGSWRYLTIHGDSCRVMENVLDLENGWISTCHSQDQPHYTVRAKRMQIVDYYGYLYVHASDVELDVFGFPVMWVPRLDYPLDSIVEYNRPRSVYANQGWFSPGVGLSGSAGPSVNMQYRFLNRPGAKGYIYADYATIRQLSLTGITELTDGSSNLLLGALGWQSPAPVARLGAWGYLRGIHTTDWGDRVEMVISGRELLGGQIVSRTPEMALVSDWRTLGLDWLDVRYSMRAGEFLVEDAKPISRLSGVLEFSSHPWRPWPGMEIQPIVQGVGRAYLQNAPLIGGGGQIQAQQTLGDWVLMARARQTWAAGANPLFYENYISDQVVGGMVLWQVLPMLRVGVFGEWSVAHGFPVALDLMGSWVSDCEALHVYYSALYNSISVKGNVLAF